MRRCSPTTALGNPSSSSRPTAATSKYDLALDVGADGTVAVAWDEPDSDVRSGGTGLDVVSVVAHRLFADPDAPSPTAQDPANGIVGWGNYVDGADAPPAPPAGEGYTQVAEGPDDGLGVLSDGTVVGWGNDAYGKLEAPDVEMNLPCALTSPGPCRKYVEVATGSGSSIGLLDNGDVVTWGSNLYDQLGSDAPGASCSSTEVEPGGTRDTEWCYHPHGSGPRYVSVAAGTFDTYAVADEDPTVSVWGPTGDADAIYAPATPAVPAGEGSRWTKFQAGGSAWAGLTDTGYLVVPRANDGGAAQDGPTGQNFPDLTSDADQGRFTDFALGAGHIVAQVGDDGPLVQFGSTEVPADGFSVAQLPVADAGHRFVALAAGMDYTMALQDDGVIKAVGRDDVGQTEPARHCRRGLSLHGSRRRLVRRGGPSQRPTPFRRRRRARPRSLR